MLPIQEHEEYFRPYFETPQSVDIANLVTSYGIPYQQIDTLKTLRNFDLSSWMDQHQGLSVIECQTDANASMAIRKKLWNYNHDID
jgi:2-succinyl-5-enolpyruvyl-6-hydroxy-3-cyclohexene-1-carboxylate synthase